MKGIEKKEKEDLHDARECFFLARSAHMQGLYSKAQKWGMKSLEIREAQLGERNLQTLDCYYLIAKVHKRMGQMDLAIQYADKVYTNKLKQLGHWEKETIHAYNLLGNLFLRKKEFLTAAGFFQSALNVEEGNLLTAYNFQNIGYAFQKAGSPSEAQVYFLKALEIRTQKLGNDHPLTLNSMWGLAQVEKILGNLESFQRIKDQIKEIKLGKKFAAKLNKLEFFDTQAISSETIE